MSGVSQTQHQEAINRSRRLSAYYHKKYPDVETAEFESIALLAIARAAVRFDRKRGSWRNRYQCFIYQTFFKHLSRRRRQFIVNRAVRLAGKRYLLHVSTLQDIPIREDAETYG